MNRNVQEGYVSYPIREKALELKLKIRDYLKQVEALEDEVTSFFHEEKKLSRERIFFQKGARTTLSGFITTRRGLEDAWIDLTRWDLDLEMEAKEKGGEA